MKSAYFFVLSKLSNNCIWGLVESWPENGSVENYWGQANSFAIRKRKNFAKQCTAFASPTWRNAAPMCRFALREDCVQVATTLFYFALPSGWKPKRNQLGAERQRRPELMCHTIVALQGQKRYFSTAAECDFSKLSNKICTIDVKIHIFASWKPTKRKETKK